MNDLVMFCLVVFYYHGTEFDHQLSNDAFK